MTNSSVAQSGNPPQTYSIKEFQLIVRDAPAICRRRKGWWRTKMSRRTSTAPSKPITASMLYDLIQCPHRVSMDLFADPAGRDPVSPFLQLLWEKGQQYEREVIEGLQLRFTDLREGSEAEREAWTLEAMRRGDSLIYGGRISEDDLLGEPDLLRLENTPICPSLQKLVYCRICGGRSTRQVSDRPRC